MQSLRLGLGLFVIGSFAACGQQLDDAGSASSDGGAASSSNTKNSSVGSSSSGKGGGSSTSGSEGGSGKGGNTADSNTSKGGSNSSGTSTGGNNASSSGDSSTTADVTNKCAQVSGETRSGVAPPVIEFVLDNTDSMSDDTQPSTKGKTKWVALQDAFTNAIPALAAQHPEYAVGLTYFHYKGYGSGGDGCTDALQAVEIAPLSSTQANTIVSNVKAEQQIQKTPTQDIWQFGADHVLSWNGGATYAASNRYVVVLTDGVPTVAASCGSPGGCSSSGTTGGRGQQGGSGSAGNSVTVAQYQTFIDAVGKYLSSRELTTFMIAIPGAEAVNQVTCSDGSILYEPIGKMQEVAIAGGTDLIDLTTSATTDFTLALIDAITQRVGGNVASVVSCDYSVPEPPTGPNGTIQFVDPNQVAVWYYENGGTACSKDTDCGSGHCSPATADNPNKCYTLVPRSAGCADPNGWDYADASNKTISLCANTCSTAQADAGAKVEVMIGCFEVG